MSASTATASAPASSLPADSPRPGRLRRLSQLRAYTQNHLSSSSSSSPSSSVNSPRSYFANRVSWLSPSSPPAARPDSTTPASCAESDHRHHHQHRAARAASTSAAPASPQRHCRQVADTTEGGTSPESSSGVARSDDSDNQASRSSQSSSAARPLQSPESAMASDTPTPITPEPSTAVAATPVANAVPDLSGPVATLDQSATQTPGRKQQATIKFHPYQDFNQQSGRPSLPFTPVTRTLPSASCVIRVGRYSERDGVPVANPTAPSDAPVGFKSKVVSRKHCEFHFLHGQWHIRDVGSSSGTFLNHMRLSQPNMASRLYAIKDGDIVQLGIDFRGGEEMIFRCVRIRIECNRSWQQQSNEFNKNTESLIKNLGKGETADTAGCRDCSICLGSVLRPYQCLFMAACAHVWHYKCISRLIHTPEYPMFQCPNCRAYTDLSAEVDDTPDQPGGDDQRRTTILGAAPRMTGASPEGTTPASTDAVDTTADGVSADAAMHRQSDHTSDDGGLAANVEDMRLEDSDSPRAGPEPTDTVGDAAAPSTPSAELSDDVHHSVGIDIPGSRAHGTDSNATPSPSGQPRSRTPVHPETPDENPMTPRNDSGPLAFDGRAGMQ